MDIHLDVTKVNYKSSLIECPNKNLLIPIELTPDKIILILSI
ncbi:MAG: hypothetical protein Edafosvirus50_3 [Edafosvirus sp.]|uniref:Uncharacterized protein n=1 Tax=Edafosvirus sp. TaxID=2487765 RepID=A0A3G4ZZZ7_9VIRU|nr:MAG: hypothetical protein Edafosvirus50_3 [Edafosvirus sp.]